MLGLRDRSDTSAPKSYLDSIRFDKVRCSLG